MWSSKGKLTELKLVKKYADTDPLLCIKALKYKYAYGKEEYKF